MNPPGMAALPPTGKTFLVYLIKTDVQGIYELGWGKVLDTAEKSSFAFRCLPQD